HHRLDLQRPAADQGGGRDLQADRWTAYVHRAQLGEESARPDRRHRLEDLRRLVLGKPRGSGLVKPCSSGLRMEALRLTLKRYPYVGSKGWRVTIVSSRSGPVEMRSIG